MKVKDAILSIVIDVLCLILVNCSWLVLEAVAEPYQNGFFCSDESIRYPYKPSTVTRSVLLGVGVGLPFVTIIITESVRVHLHKKSGGSLPEISIGTRRIPFLVTQLYKLLGAFLFGGAIVQAVTMGVKYVAGTLRPHFLDACQPREDSFSCLDNQGEPRYVIERDICMATEDLVSIRTAFPSGHAAWSSYSMVFLALYLQARFTWPGSKLLRPLLQAVLVAMAIYTCVSRVTDYHHHWSDVIAGAILGVFMAYFTVFNILRRWTFQLEKSNYLATEDVRDSPRSSKPITVTPPKSGV